MPLRTADSHLVRTKPLTRIGITLHRQGGETQSLPPRGGRLGRGWSPIHQTQLDDELALTSKSVQAISQDFSPIRGLDGAGLTTPL